MKKTEVKAGLYVDFPFNWLRFDDATQGRTALDQSVVTEYADAMTAGDKFPPLDVVWDGSIGWVWDGHHRGAAYRRIKQATVPVFIKPGKQRDAELAACGSNGGLPRKDDDKHRVVLKMLRDREWSGWSEREIARRCRVSAWLVSDLKKTHLNGTNQMTESTTRKVSRGGVEYEQNTAPIAAANRQRADDRKAANTAGIAPEMAGPVLPDRSPFDIDTFLGKPGDPLWIQHADAPEAETPETIPSFDEMASEKAPLSKQEMKSLRNPPPPPKEPEPPVLTDQQGNPLPEDLRHLRDFLYDTADELTEYLSQLQRAWTHRHNLLATLISEGRIKPADMDEADLKTLDAFFGQKGPKTIQSLIATAKNLPIFQACCSSGCLECKNRRWKTQAQVRQEKHHDRVLDKAGLGDLKEGR